MQNIAMLIATAATRTPTPIPTPAPIASAFDELVGDLDAASDPVETDPRSVDVGVEPALGGRSSDEPESSP